MLVIALMLTACGKDSPEKVLKKLNKKWGDVDGYELDATMEIKTGNEPRTYNVNVWHTSPDFYRVKVSQEGNDVTQMIIRNKEGVFVVTPSLKKTYKFQSEWPKQNSQPYLIKALAEDLLADENIKMEEDEKNYVFTAATRNNHRSIMPIQKVTVDKKTMLPKSVSILNEAEEEQMVVTFKKVDLDKVHKEKEYAVEQFTTDEKKDESSESAETESEDTKAANLEQFETYYPVLNWSHTKLVDEQKVNVDGVTRVILTFEGEKPFTLVQQPIVNDEASAIPVSAPGDPLDLGFTIGAITDNSISWENDGMSFFLASNKLSQEELLEVAVSVTSGGLK